MSKPAIVVENLSKSYRLGARERQHQSFRDALTGLVTAPFRRLRELGERGTGENTFWALKDVNFEVQPGEVVGIIGRNGAGKSTLLKVLSRIVEPTSGRIRLRGRVASLLEVGTGFHPELSGRENIYMNGSILGMRKAEIDRKFDEIVAFAEVEKFLDTPVKRYSSGMYVRLAFAVAAHLDPEILIVDEVLAVGDAEFQKKCLGRMREVSKGQGRTVLFVSHNMGAVRQLCQKAVVMANGTAQFVGPVAEGVAQYLEFQRGTVDAPTMTLPAGLIVDGIRCDDGDGGPWRTLSEASLHLSLRATRPIGRVGFRLLVESDDGVSLMDLDNYPAHPTLPLAEGRQYDLRIRLDQLPLRPGTYGIRLFLGDDHQFNRVELSHRFRVQVEPSDNPLHNHRLETPSGQVAASFSTTAEVESFMLAAG